MRLRCCETRPPSVRRLDPPMRLTRRLAAADSEATGPVGPWLLHGGTIYRRGEATLFRNNTAEPAQSADSSLLIPATSPVTPTHDEHRCLLRPPRLTTRQTRQAETREAAESACALKVGHLNVRSLTAHLDEVNLLLLREQMDVLCLSETWLTEAVDPATLLFPGYTICRCDGRVKKSGGGVAILYRNTLRAEQLQVPAGNSTLEALWIQITSRSTIVVGVAYRPPSGPTAPAIDCLHQQLTHVLARARPMYLLGDVNIDVSQRTKP